MSKEPKAGLENQNKSEKLNRLLLMIYMQNDSSATMDY